MLCDAYICISMTLGFDYVVILVCGVCMATGGDNVEFTPTVGGCTKALQPPSGEVLPQV